MSNESAPKYYVDEDGERVEIPEPDPGAQKRGLHGALVNPSEFLPTPSQSRLSLTRIDRQLGRRKATRP